MTVTDRRRQQLNGGTVHHGRPSLTKAITRPSSGSLSNRIHRWAKTISCICIWELTRARRRRRCSSSSGRVGIGRRGISLTGRGRRRPLRPFLSSLRVKRCGCGLSVRIGRGITGGLVIRSRRISDHHPLITTKHGLIIAVVYCIGVFALAPGGRELASFAFAPTSHAGRRTGVIDA